MNRASLVELYNERFLRMWEFYLAASEASFRHFGFMVFQAQIAREDGALPLTRDYMIDEERRAAGEGAKLDPPRFAPSNRPCMIDVNPRH